MDDMQLLIDLHRRQSRQGPGSDEASALALQLAALDATAPLAVADLGCGTGASTLMLARALVAAEREEIALYTQFRRYYSYGFYVAERVA